MKLSELLATGFICGLIAAIVIIATVFALDRFGHTPHDELIASVVAVATVLIVIFVGVRKGTASATIKLRHYLRRTGEL